MKPEEKITGLAGAAIQDRKTLLEGINDLMEIARNDHGISRPALIQMHEKYSQMLKDLKCEKFIEQYSEVDNG